MISFEDIRPHLKKFIQEGCETADYIMRVSKTPKDGFYAYEEMGEIVRCSDCRWFTPEETYEEYRDFAHSEIMVEPPSCGNPERCNKHYDSATGRYVPVHIVTQPDGFCAWGERKETFNE